MHDMGLSLIPTSDGLTVQLTGAISNAFQMYCDPEHQYNNKNNEYSMSREESFLMNKHWPDQFIIEQWTLRTGPTDQLMGKARQVASPYADFMPLDELHGTTHVL